MSETNNAMPDRETPEKIAEGVTLRVENVVNMDTASAVEVRAIVAAAIQAERDRAEGLVPCPCTIADKPCTPDCTCVVSHSSHGCKCCTRYGSDEQRKAAAKRLVGLADRAEGLAEEVRAWRSGWKYDCQYRGGYWHQDAPSRSVLKARARTDAGGFLA